MEEIDKVEIRKAADAMLEVISGVLIGVDTVAIIQLVGLDHLDGPLTDALYCFATSIPLLAFFVFCIRIEKTRNCSIDIWYKDFALILGILGPPIGLGLLILHLSRTVAWIFAVLCGLAVVLVQLHTVIADARHHSSESNVPDK
jgi:hypothetical protein